MTVLYPIPCYNEACYKGTLLYNGIERNSFCGPREDIIFIEILMGNFACFSQFSVSTEFFSEKFFQEYYESVKQFGSMSDCLAWSGCKVFAKVSADNTSSQRVNPLWLELLANTYLNGLRDHGRFNCIYFTKQQKNSENSFYQAFHL